MSLPRIIGITGYAQHGKDTVASVFVEHGYQRVALADALKRAVTILDPFVPWDSSETEFERLSQYVEDHGPEDAKLNPEVRRLYQVMGTQVGRELFGENVWIEVLARSVKGFYQDDGPRVVIPDIRFLNEAAFIRRVRGDVYRVVRPDFDNGVGTGHASEREIGAIFHDARFTNDLDLDHLRAQVERYIKARNKFSVAREARI